MTNVLLCVGNNMMGDDGAGPLLAKKCAAVSKGSWVVVDGGSALGSDIAAIRELRPMRLLIVDATGMGLDSGEIRIIDPVDIAEILMMTTHNMLLNYPIDRLKEDTDEVIFLDTQPDIVGFYCLMTQQIKDVMGTVYQRLEGWKGNGGFAQLVTGEEQLFSKESKELNIRTGMCAFLLSLVLPTQVISSTEYLPMGGSEYAQKQALKPLLTLPYDAGQTQHFRKVGTVGVMPERISNEEDYWQLTAKDCTGRSWFMPVGVLQNMAGDAQLYRVDLDRNDIQNLVIRRGVSGDGLAPSSLLILMASNQQGRPCVFQVDGSYTANKAGVDDLLDLQGNGHTQSLDMQFSSGYWIVSSYQIEEAKQQHVHSWFGKLSYPVLTRFTYTSNRKLVIKPVAGRNLQTKDLALTQRYLIKGDVLDGMNQN